MYGMRGKLFGGIEAGGTKFICAVGTSPDRLTDVETFETRSPEVTLRRVISFFRTFRGVAAIGIGSFGPVDPDPNSATFGRITSTPKKEWAHTDFAGFIRSELGVPVAFDTDVNVAALGEHRCGAGSGLDTFIYLTVGTGIGGGMLSAGKCHHGLLHPEMGHVRVPRAEGDTFAGLCPYHGDCLEGMASGPAIEARAGRTPRELGPENSVWTFEVHYLSMALVNYVCVLSPERIILGGGVMNQAHLFPRIRSEVLRLLNGYVRAGEILDEIDSYIVPPALGERSGIVGAVALAEEAVRRQR